MLIYLIRHLATEYNASGIYMGRSFDLPILEREIPIFKSRITGLLQEEAVRDARLFSSPSLRCRQTAAVLRDTLNLVGDIIITEEFAETDYGEFEGKSPKELKAEYYDIYFAWMNTPSQVTFPGGESFVAVQKRSFDKLLELVAQYAGQILFVVTHVDVIKMIVSRVTGIPIDSKRCFRIDTGSISCLEVEEEEMRVRYLNRT